MAIVFDCPNCKTNYRLKDDVGGKTATCKNPSCRKVIQIPQAKGPVTAVAPGPIDVDALAAAAFSEEAQAKVEEWISVTCAGCDHTWKAEASKEGKNVLCPECRKPNRVMPRKKEQKADWRTGGDGIPTLAKRETGMDREGAFATNQAAGISAQTAGEIMKGREAELEPEERRRRLFKRIAIAASILLVGSVVGFFVFRAKKEIGSDIKMVDAVKEFEAGELGKDARFKALMHRAAGEQRIRNAVSEEEAKAALNEFKLARNAMANPATTIDQQALLAETATGMVSLLGSAEQVKDGKRIADKDVVKEIRQTLQRIPATEPQLLADVARALTRRLLEKEQLGHAETILVQINPELLAQVGLELLRLDKSKYAGNASQLLSKASVSANASSSAAVQALQAAIGTPAKKGAIEQPKSAAVEAEALVLKGEVGKAVELCKRTGGSEKTWANVAGGMAAVDSSPAEAATMLEEAASALIREKNSAANWVAIRVCRGLAKLGRFDKAEDLAKSIPDEPARAWARLEILRGRLIDAKAGKADDSWLTAIGDPLKQPAAMKAHEEIARHNAAKGHGSYSDEVKKWPKGTVRSFGLAGLTLGALDRDGK